VDLQLTGVVRKIDADVIQPIMNAAARAAVAAGLLAHRRGLQPDHGRRGRLAAIALRADKLIFMTETR
jgi:amino-acid N-acetyltransferase